MTNKCTALTHFNLAGHPRRGSFIASGFGFTYEEMVRGVLASQAMINTNSTRWHMHHKVYKALMILKQQMKVDEAIGSVKDWSLVAKTNLGMHLSPYRNALGV